MKQFRVCALVLFAGALFATQPAQAQRTVAEVNLVSDIPGRALFTDANLVNPWGIAASPRGVLWVSDNGPGVSTLYNPDGTARPLVVTIPGGAPTGQVFNGESGFGLTRSGVTSRALFLFATENGTIAGWNSTGDASQATQVIATPEAVYKGLALGHTDSGPRLYAANFGGAGSVDMFDSTFARVNIAGAFVDSDLPAGYAPFNVAAIGHQVFVSFAKKDTSGEDEQHGPGLGYVDVFDPNGHFLHRFASAGVLNAPWGIVQAPPGFAGIEGSILVGNFGDGVINVFGHDGGPAVGTLRDSTGATIVIDGLWGLQFVPPVDSTFRGPRLYFAAGLDDEAHGLFGYLGNVGAPPPPPPGTCQSQPAGPGFWSHLCGPFHPDARRHDQGDDGGDGDDHDGHHGGPGPNSDSLRALFQCATAGTHAFGPGGCLTAGCELLQPPAQAGAETRLARQFLTLLLNRCSGRVCDSTLVRCSGEGDDEGGGPALPALTVGQIIARIDSALCHERTDRHALARLTALAGCANGGEGEGEDEGQDGDALSPTGSVALRVLPLSPNPVRYLMTAGMRFRISTAAPAMVRLGVYDAAGRLVAEPMRQAPVNGQADVRWDGTDLRGRQVAPGTYFYRATTGREQVGGRIVVVR
jgi:uncharacterized protein (TIGR03118 family)